MNHYPASLTPVVSEILQWYDFHDPPSVKLPELSGLRVFLGISGGILLAVAVGMYIKSMDAAVPTHVSPPQTKLSLEEPPFEPTSAVVPPLRPFLLRRAE